MRHRARESAGRQGAKWWWPVVAFLVFWAAGTAGLAAVPAPTPQIRGAVDEILGVLQDRGLQEPAMKEARRKRITSVVEDRFDFTQMAMRTLGRHWKERSAVEQEHFAELLSTLLENLYIGKIENYSDQEIIYKKEIVRGDKAQVSSVIVNNGTEIPLDYRLLLKDGKWWVYDVVIEGVSLVGNYRSQFESELNRSPYSELVKKLEEKVAAQEEGK